MANSQNWTTEFFKWTDENHISAEKLPRDEETLLSQTALNLSFCKLTQLPESLGNLTHLTELDLAYNALTEIPEWIDNFTALEKLDVSGNSITSLPDSLRHLPNLEIKGLDKQIKKGEKMAQKSNLPLLQLRQKQQIQTHLLPLPKNTAWMDEIFAWANENKISKEQLPQNKKILWSLRKLDLENNKLTKIPESVGNLSNVHFLYLNKNQLTEIPEFICNLTNLKLLGFQDNLLTDIPDFISNLTNLTMLGLSGNKLTKLPESIGNLTNLKNLCLIDNELTTVPESIANLTNLLELSLDKNKLTALPESMSNLIFLEQFALGNNLLTVVPNFIEKLKNLTHLGLENNRFNEIPEMISHLPKLSELHLGNNPLTKTIPESVSQMPNLRIIGLEQLTQSKNHMKTYQQKILFGSPGTGKSYKIDKQIISNDLKITNSANVIKTVFHPEYTYGDFVGKLMPITVGGNVQYKFYEGHFLKALSQAYKNIIAAQDNDGKIEKVALVIDEINRGNSAAIFGTIFQLLDREPDGWSSYEVSVNEIIFNRLIELCDLKGHAKVKEKAVTYMFGEEEIKIDVLQKKLLCHFENRTIKIPPNLSILASMNTSDSSIYYMDSAFKRRWEWEFIDVDSNTISAEGVAFENRDEWKAFVGKLNAFIKSNHKSIRGIEDKQIGHFFITDEQILRSSVQNKLMFFLWDSVFNRDKKPLVKLLFDENTENELITFGDFAVLVREFIDKINGYV